MSRFKLPSLKRFVLIWVPLAVVLLLSGSLYWLLNSSSGAAWLWKSVAGLETVDLRSSKVTGDLSSGFVIEDMEYRSEDLDLLVQRAEVKVGPAWWPLSIRVDSLHLNNVSILTRSSAETVPVADEGQDIRNTLASISLPVPLKINDTVLTQVSLQQNGEPSVALAQRVSLQAALDEQLVVDFLDIQAKGFETRLQGFLELESPFNLNATAVGRLEVDGEAGDTVLDVPFNLEGSGNLDKLRLNLASHEMGLQLDSEVVNPVSDPMWEISAKLDQFHWQDEASGQDLELSGLSLGSKGKIDDWLFTMESLVRMAEMPESLLGISGSGSANGIEVTDAALTGTGIDLGLTGKLDWSSQTRLALKAVIRQLDLSPWLPDWPSGETLAGTLELNWSGHGLQIPASELTISGTDLALAIEADIDTGSNEANARLAWRNLNWPLTAATPDFSSKSGQLNVSGRVDDWVTSGGLEVQLGDYPPGSFEVQGNGNRTSAHLVIPGGSILGGSLGGAVDADWSQGLSWSAAVLAQGIDPEPLVSGWPGRLDAELEISVQSQSQQTHIDLLALSGQLRDVPVSAHGAVKILGPDLVFDSLEVRTDEAMMVLNGSTAQPEGAMLTFKGYIPSKLLAGASGSMELEGRYSNHADRPQIEISLQALDLAWNDVQLDKASLVVSSLGEQQELKLSLVSEDVALNSVMSLSAENQRDPFGGAWTGELAELVMDVGPAYQFQLSKPAAFAWSAGSALIGPLCLSENTEASLCLEFDYQSEGDWSLQADATAVPVNYLRDMLELDLHFEQLLEGHMEWHQPRDGPPTGGAEFRITAGRVLDMLDDDLLAESNEGRFAFTLQNGNLESGNLDIEFPGTGFIDVDFEVLDIARDGLKEVQGRAVTRLDHFKLLGQLALPGVDAVDGKFESNIQLGGSLEDPEFDGAFKFSEGYVHYAPIGLQLEDIEFEGQVTQRDRGSFKGHFRAGEGIASLQGGFLFENLERAKLEVSLLGDQLLLVNTESLKILTETDISVALSPQRMDINGKINIPSASLTPANLLLGEVRDSEDLLIETAGIEAQPDVAKTTARTLVYGQLEVAIGDDVNLKVPGVETSISGSTIFTWSGASVPMAEGSYTLNGNVDVYGPVLNIRNGSISFPGVPADNPLLNIRAGRDIFGNTQIRSAGVQVTGRAKRPVLEAYTVPVTNEDRAWTLLITGSDFDQAQGVSGFDVGAYIAPKLYVSYGISLFEDENVISARYDIKKGFGVKVTSGQRETGLDVSYTIDR